MLRTLLRLVTVCAIKRKVPYHDDVWLPGNRFGATAKGLPLQYKRTHFEALCVIRVFK